MMNYEAYRAMYEGRNAQLFAPDTGIITWMSNPAQPSFVWQLYHYDLEPFASLFAVKSAAELVHIQMNEITGNLQVINNLPQAIAGDTAHVAVYSIWGGSHPALETDIPSADPLIPRSTSVPRLSRTGQNCTRSTSLSSISAMRRVRSFRAICTGNHYRRCATT